MRARTSRMRVAGAACLLCLCAVAAFAQRRDNFFGGGTFPNIPYDGRFTFVRVKYTPGPGGYWAGPSWAHGYPLAEQNLMRIIGDISLFNVHSEGINVLTLDDPELFRYPIAYIIEVGWWTLTDKEAAALKS